MDKHEIVRKIEKYAPLELAENWDCSGWAVNTCKCDVKKVMLALTVTEDIIKQAREKNCDMIISHHPLFFVPLSWCDIDIYSAHTNMDRTEGGTTDKLINSLGLEKAANIGDFVRLVSLDSEIDIQDFIRILKSISPNLRYVNNFNKKTLQKIAFCAGSGSEFIPEAFEYGADAFVTGDLKFHTALESPIIVFDIGHFESEIMILDVFENILSDGIEVIKAVERSPFISI
ncbi:MAG TPA: Nif3-like dinuclear metal center hexameric protein [Candidatus Stercorousia faecigallinarum]|nr:Nif3-like dinuclear metal center hexameric protein [Candidatus Stercorousia faecigallinarum]